MSTATATKATKPETSTLKADPAAAEGFLRMILGDDANTIEINRNGTYGKLFESIADAAAETTRPKTKAAFFFVPNPVDGARRAAYVKSEKAKGRKSPRTRDDHVIERRWLLLDFDPVRPVGVCSTDAEKDLARQTCDKVRDFLAGKGFPSPAVVDSGNGFHLYFACELPNDNETKALIQRFLVKLDKRFGIGEKGDGLVNVDRGVFKAAQLLRLPGTINRKGPNDMDRPHRRVTMLETATRDRLVTVAQLLNVAGPAPEKPVVTETLTGNSLNVDAYCDTYDIERYDTIDRTNDDGTGYVVYEIQCPFDPSHDRGEAIITLGVNGALGFRCLHNSCIEKRWEEFTELVGPPTLEHYPQKTAADDFEPFKEPPPEGFAIRSSRDVKKRTINERPYVVNGLFRIGDIANVSAPPKSQKSWAAIAMALAVANGLDWLGFETQRGDVLYIDNELHSSDWDKRQIIVADKMGIDLADPKSGAVDVINLRDGGKLCDLNGLRQRFQLIERGRYNLIILDAFYRFLPKKASENDNGDVTQLYNKLAEYCAMTGAAIVLIHHTSKGNQSDKSTTDVGSGAGAMGRAADCHFIIRAHELEDYAVVDAAVRTFKPLDQFSIKWEWPLWSRTDEAPALAMPKTKNDTRQSRNDDDGVEKLVGILNGADGEPVSERELKKLLGVGDTRKDRLIKLALDSGSIILDRTGKNQKGGKMRYLRLPDAGDLF